MSITPLDPANFNPTLKGITRYGAFRFWCQQVLPLTFDDSLSYYELLNKVVDYLNKTMENVNDLGTDIESLGTAYGELENYVNTYFSSLDVQQEIDNKLDEMASDGSLSNLISPFIPNLVSEWLNENVEPVGSAVVVDSSLTISGAAADAKVSGDKINELNSDIINGNGFRYIVEARYYSYKTDIKNGKTYTVVVNSGKLKLYTRATADGENIDTIIDPASTGYKVITFTATADANYLRILADTAVDLVLFETESIPGNVLKILKGDLSNYYSLASINNSEISAGTNYDNLTTPGVYRCISASNASTIINCPVSSAHSIIVQQTSVSNRYSQIVLSDSGIYFRYYNGTWTTWNKIITDIFINELMNREVGIENKYKNISGYKSEKANIRSGVKYYVHVSEGTLRLYTRATPDGENIDTIIGSATTAPISVSFTASADANYLRILADSQTTFSIIEEDSILYNTAKEVNISDQSFSVVANYASYPADIKSGRTYLINLTSGKMRLFTRATASGDNIDSIIGDASTSSTAKTAPYKTVFTATENANYLRVLADTACEFTIEDCSTVKGQLDLLHYYKVFELTEYQEDIYAPYPQLPANTDPNSDFDSDNMTSQDVYDYLDAIMTKYPQLLTKTTMGKDASNTYDVNRYVYADSTRTEYFGTIYIGANEHGPSSDPRECAIVVCRLLKDLCEGHAKTNRFLNIIKKYFRVVTIPVANPWGFNTNHRNNYNGVNINRNYPTVPGWENCPDTDKGTSAGSEVETQYIVNTIETFNPVIALDLHCLGYVNDANDMKCHYAGVVKNNDLINEIKNEMKRDYNLTCTSYGNGDYTTHSDGDSYFAYKGIDGMLLEFQARDGVTSDQSAVLHSGNIIEANYTFMLRIINMLMTVYNSAWDTQKI